RGEATGVLTWIVEGCLEWQRAGQKTNPPAAVVEATRAYKDGEDDLGAFLEERTARGDNPLEGKTLYQSYTAWCDATGSTSLTVPVPPSTSYTVGGTPASAWRCRKNASGHRPVPEVSGSRSSRLGRTAA